MRSDKGWRMAIVAVALLAAFGAKAEALYADFTQGELPSGWSASEGKLLSPGYGSAVDRIELRYSGADASASATVQALPANGEGVDVATFTAASSGASFDFPDTTDFRSFSITTNGLVISSFRAYVSESFLAAPSGVAISNNVTGTSFDAYWNPVADATGYRIYVWTNIVTGASEGMTVWQETFANSPAKTSTVNFKDEFTDNGTSGWTFEKAYASITNGAVRIGTTSDKGVLVSPQLSGLSGAPFTLRVTAWRQSTSDGKDMPVGVVSGGVTNIVGVVAIGDESATYHVALPAFNAGDRIALFSPTNKTSARAIIDDVAIVSGYSEGYSEPSYIVNGLDVGAVTAHSFSGLPSVPVQFAVEAYGRRGVSSAKTEAVVVDLSNPDPVPVLNACPMSSLVGNPYTQNFDSFAALTFSSGDKDLLNGTTIPYWQWFKNALAAGTFKWNAGSGTTGGIYALATNQSETVRSMGAYSTKDNEFSFGIAFTNDTDRAIKLSSLAYLAQQWGFANTTNQTLSVVAKVADGLDWISSYGEGWMELASTESVVYGTGDPHDTPVSTPVMVSPEEEISIAPGQVLILKWTIHSLNGGKPSMMGIDDVSVTFEPAKQGLFLRIASTPAQ